MRSLIQNSWKYQGLLVGKDQLISNYLRFNFSAVNAAKNAGVANTRSANKSKSNTNPEEIVKEVAKRTMKIDRLNFSPHEYYITQGLGMERPFTGDKWFEKDVGYYHCVVCETKLFTWDQKFQTPNGMASFWHHENNAIKVIDSTAGVQENFVNLEANANQINHSQEKKRVCCAKCQSNLGLVFFDGPPPTFKRFSINSAALKFIKKEDWENPHFITRKRKFKQNSEHNEIERRRSVLLSQQSVENQQSSSSSSSSSTSSSSEKSE